MTEKENQQAPVYTDYEWTDYVLSLLRDKEVFNDKPTVDGLRRVAQLLLGRIQECSFEILQVPCEDNGMSATVKARILIDGRIYEGSTNVNEASAPNIIGSHTVALAETRAEGRALRRALNLRIITSEEAQESIEVVPNKNMISNTQIDAIKKQTEKNKINLDKLLVLLYNTKVENINTLTFDQALGVFEKLSEYTSSKIPEELID